MLQFQVSQLLYFTYIQVARGPSKTPTASSTTINTQPQNSFQLMKPSPSISASYITEDSISYEFKLIADVLRTKTQEEWDKRNKVHQLNHTKLTLCRRY